MMLKSIISFFIGNKKGWTEVQPNSFSFDDYSPASATVIS